MVPVAEPCSAPAPSTAFPAFVALLPARGLLRCAAGISPRGRTYTPVETTTSGFHMRGLLCGCLLRSHSLEHFLVSFRDLCHIIMSV